jgi:hypothetical protein
MPTDPERQEVNELSAVRLVRHIGRQRPQPTANCFIRDIYDVVQNVRDPGKLSPVRAFRAIGQCGKFTLVQMLRLMGGPWSRGYVHKISG